MENVRHLIITDVDKLGIKLDFEKEYRTNIQEAIFRTVTNYVYIREFNNAIRTLI